MSRINLIISRIREYSEMTDVGSLSRRYFVIGAFDGVLTILGMIVGAFFTSFQTGQPLNLEVLISAGISASFALGISSGWGAYEAEFAENKADFEKMEQMMVQNMDGTIREDAQQFATIVSSLVHGVAPIPAGLIPIIPLFFFTGIQALLLSVGLSLIVLFFVGIFLGYVSKRNLLYCGFRLILAGVITSIVSLLLGASH